ncbi:MAG: acyl-CoA dehydrogenase family protein [Deltaproteobacteria bacterium]|nr:acyl-CoA dehydrogenase family protein [Deltaproteobacteria bacterium]
MSPQPWTDSPPDDAAARGRAALTAWLAAQPTDLFADDAELRALVEAYGFEDRAPGLSAAGRAVAGPLDAAVRENNLHRNLPVLDDYDAVGNYRPRVSHHPSWREAGRIIYGTGIMAAYGEARRPHRYVLSLFYLTAQAGEAGHNCPLACAAGAIRVLQELGTPAQQARYLSPLLNPDFDQNFTASQFLTEVQGGSDVGANALIATPVERGRGAGSRWTLRGEKWFCSNVDADVYVITARVADPARGTAGLGLFLVPALRADGRPNRVHIRRLKDKLGTRSMASGELDLLDAEAEAIGPVDDGFKNVIQHVITTSRLYNATGCAAHARRAWVVASTYAQHRAAFGRPIGAFATVQETLAWMRADAAAMLAGSLWLAALAERQDAGALQPPEAAFFRVAVNLHKLRTAQLAHEAVNRGIEVLGGNGAIESFSVLPRLLRDNVVYENWEGTHNVLRAQVLRDCERYGVHEGFFAVLAGALPPEDWALLAADREAIQRLLLAPAPLRELGFRPLADRLATYVMRAAMAGVEALAGCAALTRRHLVALPLDEAYLALIGGLQR